MSTTLAECVIDADCNRTLVCYVNTSFLKPGTAVCDCENVFYGWIGENCDEFGPTTIFVFTLAFFANILTIPFLVSSFVAGFDVLSNRELISSSPVLRTFLFISVAFLFYFLNTLGLMLERANPQLYTEIVNGVRVHQFSALPQVANVVIILTFVLSLSSIVSVWLEIAHRVDQMLQRRVLTRAMIFIWIVELYTGGVGIFLLVTWDFNTGLVLLIPVCIAYLILYPIGQHRFIRVLRKDTNSFSKMMPLIKRTFFMVELGLVGMVSSFIAASLQFRDARDETPVGEISPLMVSILLLIISTWIGAVGILSYVLALMYNSRVKMLGRPKRYELVEGIVFAGYSSFEESTEPTQRVSENPRHHSTFSSTPGGATDVITTLESGETQDETGSSGDSSLTLREQAQRDIAAFATKARKRLVANATKAKAGLLRVTEQAFSTMEQRKKKQQEESGVSTITSPSEVQEEKREEDRWRDLKY